MELAALSDYPALEGRAQMQVLRPQAVSAGGLPIEIVHLLDVLARIELRRQARLREAMQEGKD